MPPAPQRLGRDSRQHCQSCAACVPSLSAAMLVDRGGTGVRTCCVVVATWPLGRVTGRAYAHPVAPLAVPAVSLPGPRDNGSQLPATPPPADPGRYRESSAESVATRIIGPYDGRIAMNSRYSGGR